MTRTRGYSIGVDYGTNSVRAVMVGLADGREYATSVYAYPGGKQGILLDAHDPNLARQRPGDYLRGFDRTVSAIVAESVKRVRHFSPEQVVGIGIDTTGSTPLPLNAQGKALAMTPEFRNHPAAQAWLWKDHTAHAEAAEITGRARQRGEPYLAKCGGTYSSEWFWSKILHCLRVAPDVFKAAETWVEACDFVPAYLCGITDPVQIPRSVCAAGHKAMYGESWGGLPSEAFLRALAPELAALRSRLYTHAVSSDQVAGRLCRTVARRVGLPAGIPVAVGGFDAHFGAVGAGIKPGRLVKIMGTSTCDLMVSNDPDLVDVPGICGMVPGSVLPGMIALEAGQSAVGDIFSWFVSQLCPARFTERGDPFVNLAREASRVLPGESGLLALDWNNGNRTVLVDPLLSGLLIGQTLHTTAPEVMRALMEATAFGALTIIRRFEAYGVAVREIVACGGIAEKNPLIMQMLADICGCPIKISRSSQTCALGGAIFGAVAGGAYRSVPAAQKAMTGVKTGVYRPNQSARKVYESLYALYAELHDAFGAVDRQTDVGQVMKRLIAIRDGVRAGKRKKGR